MFPCRLFQPIPDFKGTNVDRLSDLPDEAVRRPVDDRPAPARPGPASRSAPPAGRRARAASSQAVGNGLAAGRGDDAVVGRVGRMADAAVAVHQAHAGHAQRVQVAPRHLVQRLQALDRDHALGQPRQQRRLVAAAGADLQRARRDGRCAARWRRRTATAAGARPPTASRSSGRGRSAGWCPRRPGSPARCRRSDGAAPRRTPPATRGGRCLRCAGAPPCARASAVSRPRPMGTLWRAGRPARPGAAAGARRDPRAAAPSAAGRGVAAPGSRPRASGNLRAGRSAAVIRRPCRPSAASGRVAWSVRSTCSGVIETRRWRPRGSRCRRRPRARRRPGRSSRSCSPRGFFCAITGSLAWRRPRRVVAPGSVSASGRFGNVDVEQPGRRLGRIAQHVLDHAAARRAPAASRCGPALVLPARTRSPECRTGSPPSPRRRCPSRACRRPCCRRC